MYQKILLALSVCTILFASSAQATSLSIHDKGLHNKHYSFFNPKPKNKPISFDWEALNARFSNDNYERNHQWKSINFKKFVAINLIELLFSRFDHDFNQGFDQHHGHRHNSGKHCNTGSNVSTVPVPAAAWLFGSALIGLGGLKRRKSC